MKKGLHRSPLFYVGDKYKLMEEIKTHFPPNINRFIEPFVGGGSTFMNVDANRYLANDIDSNVINIHRMLCSYSSNPDSFFEEFFTIVEQYGMSLSYLYDSVPDELKKAYPKLYFAKYNKNAYQTLRNEYNQSDRSSFLTLYVLMIYGFNRMLRFNGKGDFNVPVGNVDFNNNTYNALCDYFNQVQRKNIEWYSEDFRIFLNKIQYEENDLIYLDPPYLITFSEYNKLWNDETEIELLRTLDSLNEEGIKFAISNVTHYKGKINKIFLNWSSKYNSYPIKSNYISFNDNSNKIFKEVLITNYQ